MPKPGTRQRTVENGIVKLSMERQLRGVARGRITKLVQQIKDYFKNETDISIKGLELFLVKLNAAENHLNETNRACIPAITEANILSEFKTIDEYEETIIETKFHVTEKINEMKCSQSVSANESLNLGRMDIRDRNIIKMPKNRNKQILWGIYRMGKFLGSILYNDTQ